MAKLYNLKPLYLGAEVLGLDLKQVLSKKVFVYFEALNFYYFINIKGKHLKSVSDHGYICVDVYDDPHL